MSSFHSCCNRPGRCARSRRTADPRHRSISSVLKSSDANVALLLVVAGMRDGQPVAHQGASGMTSTCGRREFAGADGRRQLASSVKPSAVSACGDLGGRFVEQFALDDAQHIGGDAGVEVDLAARSRRGRRCRGSRPPPRRVRPRSAGRTATLGRATALQQIQQVPLGFADPPADRGQFHRRGLAGQVPLSLIPADDAPAQRGQRQPPPKRRRGRPRHRRPLRRRTGSFRRCPARRRRGARARRTARPGCRTRPGPRTPRRCAPVPSPARRPGRIRRRSGCPSGSRRAPGAAATAAAGAPPATERPLERRRGVAHLVEPVRHSASWSAWVRPTRRVGAMDGGQRLRALPQQPLAAGVVEARGGSA